MQCACCSCTEGVQLEASRTAYSRSRVSRYTRLMFDDPINDEPPDPNAPIPLCRDCAESHHAEWDERWRDYYASLL